MLFDENPSLVSNINALEVPGSNICCCMQSVVFGIEKEVKSLWRSCDTLSIYLFIYLLLCWFFRNFTQKVTGGYS